MPDCRIDPLPPRTLRTTFGLDPAFGTGGTADLDTESAAVVLDAGSRLYVGSNTNGGDEPAGTVTRLTESGSTDAGWGNHGVATLPFNPVVMAYDKRTGGLYVAGQGFVRHPDADPHGQPGSDTVLAVLRLKADGTRDTGFGTAGIVTYAAGTGSDSHQTTYTAAPTHLLPVAHGRLYVGVETEKDQSQNARVGDFSTESEDKALLVLRLRSDGRRDTAFGRRGVATIATGGFSGGSDGVGDAYGSGNFPTLAALAPAAGDTLHAVVGVKGTDYSSTYDGDEDDYSTPTYAVQTFDVNAAGKTHAAAAWTLLKAGGAKANVARFGEGPQSVVDAGGGRVTVLDHTSTVLVSLTPGKAPIVRAVPTGDDLTADTLLPDGRGGYLLGGTFGPGRAAAGGAVARLTPKLAVDQKWGDRGLVGVTSRSDVSADARGRVLLLDGTVLERFDGTLATARQDLSAAPGAARVADDVLLITGTAAADRIAFKGVGTDPNGDGDFIDATNHIVVTINGKAAGTFDRNAVSVIRVNAGAGNDRIALGGLRPVKLYVLAGDGNDRVTADYFSGDAADAIYGGNGNDTFDFPDGPPTLLDGGAGRDALLNAVINGGVRNVERGGKSA